MSKNNPEMGMTAKLLWIVESVEGLVTVGAVVAVEGGLVTCADKIEGDFAELLNRVSLVSGSHCLRAQSVPQRT